LLEGIAALEGGVATHEDVVRVGEAGEDVVRVGEAGKASETSEDGSEPDYPQVTARTSFTGAADLSRYVRQTRRTATRLSQEELARKAGYSTAYIRKIEAGSANPTIEAVKRITDALAASVREANLQTRSQDRALVPSPVTTRPPSRRQELALGQLASPAPVNNVVELLSRMDPAAVAGLKAAYQSAVPGKSCARGAVLRAWVVFARDRPGLVVDIALVPTRAGLDMTVFQSTPQGVGTALITFAAPATERQVQAVQVGLSKVKQVLSVTTMDLSEDARLLPDAFLMDAAG
jgi:transcriptional regulator with XRE-family HTH domain